MNLKIPTLLLSSALMAGSLLASEDAGLPGEFLNFGVGARPMGMGKAFTAVSDDVDAIYWNPAGLSTFRSSQVTFQHSPLKLETSYNYIGYAQPVYAHGSLGVGVVTLSAGDVPRTDSNNSTIGSFDHRETGYLLAYGHRFGEKLGLGSTVKMAEKSIDGRSERGFGADAGIHYRWNERLTLGAVARNLIAPSYDYSSDKETFPTIFRTGAAMNFFSRKLTTALDLDKTIGTSQGMKWHFGLEGHVIDNIFLRAGVDETEIATGLGLKWRSIQFDYAAAFQTAGFLNRFSMKFMFGGYEVDVKASPSVFSPVGLKNKVNFAVRTSSRSRIVKWVMSIRNGQNEVVKSFQGFNAPPDSIEWDGKDASGRVADPGRYTYRMMITDTSDRSESTPVRSIEILAPTPFELEAK